MEQIQQNQNQIMLCTDGAKNKNSTAAAANLTRTTHEGMGHIRVWDSYTGLGLAYKLAPF